MNRDTIITEDTSNAAVEYVTLEERLRVMIEHTKLFLLDKILLFARVQYRCSSHEDDDD